MAPRTLRVGGRGFAPFDAPLRCWKDVKRLS